MVRKISLLLVIGLLVAALGGCAMTDPEDTAAAVEAMGRVSSALEGQQSMVQAGAEAMEDAAQSVVYDVAAAAETLGVTEQEIKDALGVVEPGSLVEGEPDWEDAAETLSVTVGELMSALGVAGEDVLPATGQ